jgi:putative component of toxin-antitoxin plasmid stabilization module
LPQSDVVFFQAGPGDVPALDWLRGLQRTDRRAFAKCVARIQRLTDAGFELRRPEADFLRDGIYELRIRVGKVNYRILYFFHGRVAAVLLHGLTKEGSVPNADIERAVRRKELFEATPARHTYVEELA